MVRAAGAEQVAQQRDLADPAGLGEGHRAGGAGSGEVEAGGGRRGRVAEEEGGYREVELVGPARGEEITQDPRAAFDEKTRHAPFGQILEHEIGGHRVTCVNEYGAVLDFRG